jgi:hypothetical protein
MNISSDPPEDSLEPSTISREPEKKETSPALKEFEQQLARLQTPEEKVAFGLGFMRSSIGQEGSPRFREFWEARRWVLPCFREGINPAIRSKLWEEYVELTVEARRLKDILEEQSSFAVEQIELAIGGIEKELQNFQVLLEKAPHFSFPSEAPSIHPKGEVYNQIQRELSLLNTMASRLSGLRKEVIKTDMRIRFKTKFFKRLSELGDQIFPKRKQKMDEISELFLRDVEGFVARHFQEGRVVGAPYFALREEIKALQGIAKVFTLSSAVFNKTRLLLSQCWDQLKVLEKERKKVVQAKRAASLEQELLNDAAQKQEKAIEEEERQKILDKKAKVAALKEAILRLIEEGPSMEISLLERQLEEWKASWKETSPSKFEQLSVERSLRQLKTMMTEKKETALLNLNEDQKEALQSLQQVLEQRKQRRQEIKEQLEQHRKALSSSNLDFEKAMLLRELLEQEKEMLDKANQGIEEVEIKIEELER